MAVPTYGSFQLTSVGKLPNVSVAFPGEHWSDGRVSPGVSSIVPGSLVVPVASGGLKYWQVAASGALDPRACIALRPISVPDINPGSEYNPQLTPNDIMNLPLASNSFVHTYRSGAFHLTLIKADSSYAPGDLVCWDPAATPVGNKPGPGAWTKTPGGISANSQPSYALFEVEDWRPLTYDNTQGILTVHSLRVQF